MSRSRGTPKSGSKPKSNSNRPGQTTTGFVTVKKVALGTNKTTPGRGKKSTPGKAKAGYIITKSPAGPAKGGKKAGGGRGGRSGSARGGGRGGRGGSARGGGRGGSARGGRGNAKPRTAEELDAEMDDYFVKSGDDKLAASKLNAEMDDYWANKPKEMES